MSPTAGRRAELEAVFRSAVAAVEPGAVLARQLTRDREGRLVVAGRPLEEGAPVVVLAAGKAAAPMAAAVERWAGPRLAGGLAVVKDGYGVPLRQVALREAAHPVPDGRSERAGREALRVVERVPPGALLLVLLSGGASSLLSTPDEGLDPSDLEETTAALLAGGAPIDELNAVRKHLSAVAGGRLALRARARRIEVLAISDVPDDRLDVLASGPFAGDASRFADAMAAIDRVGRARFPERVVARLQAGVRGECEETPKPGDPRLAAVRHTVVANNATALSAAESAARERGWRVHRVTGRLAGEARRAGRRLAALAASVRSSQRVCLIAGGETVVTVRGSGRGGRSQELALAAACAIEGRSDLALLAAGTDGTDGPTEAAGAYVDGGTVARGVALGIDARARLADNDSHGFFAREGGLLRTGPTRTNVMDLVLALVEGDADADPAAGSV